MTLFHFIPVVVPTHGGGDPSGSFADFRRALKNEACLDGEVVEFGCPVAEVGKVPSWVSQLYNLPLIYTCLAGRQVQGLWRRLMKK